MVVEQKSTFEERFPPRESAALQTLAANLRRIRTEKGMSQGSLASSIKGVDQTAISLIENSRSNPALTMIEAIAEALGVTVLELLDPGAPTRGKKR
jgi:transcriptional regulator with XRE-family HTH domain